MERLERLRRRRDWLKRRIANHRGDPGFDKAELSALKWANRFIEDVTAWPGSPNALLSNHPTDGGQCAC